MRKRKGRASREAADSLRNQGRVPKDGEIRPIFATRIATRPKPGHNGRRRARHVDLYRVQSGPGAERKLSLLRHGGHARRVWKAVEVPHGRDLAPADPPRAPGGAHHPLLLLHAHGPGPLESAPGEGRAETASPALGKARRNSLS